MGFLRENNAVLNINKNTIEFENSPTESLVDFYYLANERLPKFLPDTKKNSFELQVMQDTVIERNETKYIVLKWRVKHFYWYHETFPNITFLID